MLVGMKWLYGLLFLGLALVAAGLILMMQY